MAQTGFRKGAKMERFEKALENPSKALKQIGAMMVSEFQRSFKAQGFGGERWKARAPINIYGIISDFHAGKSTPPSRRFKKRPVLIDTGGGGGMSASFGIRVSGNTVIVDNTKPYADKHMRGGPIESLPITADVQRKVSDFISRGSVSDEVFNRLAFLLDKRLTGTTLKGEVVARPFMGITKQLVADVEEMVGVNIFEVR